METLLADRPRLATLFAEDFDAPHATAGVIMIEDEAPDAEFVAPPVPPAPSPNLDLVREEAYAEGVRSGLAQAAADRAEITRAMLSAIAERIAEARSDAAEIAERQGGALARLMMTTLGQMLPATCARHGGAEVAALVRAVVPALVREPRVTIRVSPHVADAVRAELEHLDPELAPHVILVPTDAVPPGDARIAWQDGGADRNTAALWCEIAAVLAPLGLLDEPPALMRQTMPAQ